MFQCLLVVIGSDIPKEQNIITWRPWETQINTTPLDLTLKPVINAPSSSRISSKTQISCPYTKKLDKIEILDIESNLQDKIENNLYYIKANHLKIRQFNDRTKLFKDLLQKWSDEVFNIRYDHLASHFLDDKAQKKYNRLNNLSNNWLRNFKEILDFYLPQIKIEVMKSSIAEISKSTIFENIKDISDAMRYYDNLKPKNLKYTSKSNLLKIHYKLMIDRFPYLFDYFNLFRKFISLYEMIIPLYSQKVLISLRMIQIFYPMSMNLTYIAKNRENFYTYISCMLEMLEALELPNDKKN
ncbi:uncharacterized protein VNE69_08170 [Vairimorpha necatrix]|uniref:Uncharacterized protein n=1 Tax=Vairimorpha necatrix TaxID=6039 RepID=A0AAX4JEI1_9MICR